MNIDNNTSLAKLVRVAILGLIMVAFLRVPIMATKDCRDFAIIYLSSISWIHGTNPYERGPFYNYWSEAGGPPEEIPGWPSFYPICTFPLIAPLTLLKWPYAKIIWTLINCGAFIGLLILLMSMINYQLNELKGIVVFGFSLFFTPSLVAIVLGQPVILSMLCGVLSFRENRANRWLSSGIWLAFSLSLKLNLGAIFLGYFIIYRRWKIMGVSLLILVAITSIGALKLGLSDFSWFGSWIDNLQVVSKEWATTKPALNNPNSIFLLNIQYPLYMFTDSKFIANAIAYTIGFIEFIILLIVYKYNEGLYGNLTMLTTIATIVIISSYHRLADASILILLLVLIVLSLKTKFARYGKLLMVLFLPLYLPGPGLLQNLVARGVIPTSIGSLWWWNTLVLPYQVYCLSLMSIVMMFLVVVDKRDLSIFTEAQRLPHNLR